MPSLAKPAPAEFPAYFAKYIDKVPETDIALFLAQQRDAFLAELHILTEGQSQFRYAPGKWSIKEFVCHLGDTERIFAYRLLRIGRADQTPLPGFDENAFIAHSGADNSPWKQLIDDFATVREATLSLIRNLPSAAWHRIGTSNNNAISARALAYMIAGHVEHHRQGFREHPPR